MTLRELLVAQLTVQVGWTCEARLAPAFLPAALTRSSLAVSSNNASGVSKSQFFLSFASFGNETQPPSSYWAVAFFLYSFPMFRAGVYNGLTSRKPTGHEGDRLERGIGK